MALLFFSTNAQRREQVRGIWESVSPESPFMAVDDIPDAALQGQSGFFDLMLIDGDDPDSTAVLLRFMRRQPRSMRVLVYGASGEHGDWSRLGERLQALGFSAA